MAIEKRIAIDGKEVPFKASAAIPRIYRTRFGRDLYKDMASLEGAVAENDAGASTLDIGSLEVFENMAYIMAKHADPSIPDTPEDWLDEFEMFSIYQIFPEIFAMWAENIKTDVAPKKN